MPLPRRSPATRCRACTRTPDRCPLGSVRHRDSFRGAINSGSLGFPCRSNSSAMPLNPSSIRVKIVHKQYITMGLAPKSSRTGAMARRQSAFPPRICPSVRGPPFGWRERVAKRYNRFRPSRPPVECGVNAPESGCHQKSRIRRDFSREYTLDEP